MTVITSANLQHDDAPVSEPAVRELVREVWSKPEIVDYQPVTVARGVQWRIGDGVSNLS
ncbi:MAG TPA: hypothetical protein VLG14_00705 [Sphingomonas sp.]|nr:hypothetical protein [Sphingomonas sp.]